MLLFAAGENVDIATVKKYKDNNNKAINEIINVLQEGKLDTKLKHSCMKAIGDHHRVSRT